MINDDFKKAYEDDMERKLVREDELNAAKEYLGVLLKEMEGQNEELSESRKEADELQERLDKTESEIAELKELAQKAIADQAAEKEQQQKIEKDREKSSLIWIVFSIVEFLFIIALGLVILLSDRNEKHPAAVTPEPDKVQVSETVTPLPSVPVLTPKHSPDLEEHIKYMSHDAITPFVASVEKIDGLEYLVFTSGIFRVCYKNEFYPDEMGFRKAVIVEEGDRRLSLSKSYDFEGDIASLCPSFTYFGNTKYLIFTEYSNADNSGVPNTIRAVNCADFSVSSISNVAERVAALTVVSDASDATGLEEYPHMIKLDTARASYKYAVSQTDYNDIIYNGYELPDVTSEFELTIGAAGISFLCNVKLGEDIYLGELEGKLIPSDSGFMISDAKFGAFAPANIFDPSLNSVIIAAKARPERFKSIGGDNHERFYIAINESVRPNELYKGNLNTEDKNDWKFYDADGNLISHRGIDVSKFQGNIDWKKVAEAGVEFAIVRLGYRGMNQGTLEIDPYFVQNMKGAEKAGIKLGVYFFSQAINEAEAVEEAEFVLENIKDYKLSYPIAFDTEIVTTNDARANGLTMQQRTDVAKAFMERIAEAGYTPMVYANTRYMITGIDLSQIDEYARWYAVYSSEVNFPYGFEILQYSESGSVPGIDGAVDLDIAFVNYADGE